MGENDDFPGFVQALVDKTVTKEGLLNRVKREFCLFPLLLKGLDSSKAAVRHGCAKVLTDLSDEHPEKLYPHFGSFIELLDSRYRILTCNALAIIANLTPVDADKKFDAVFSKYYCLLNNDYMVTVANVVDNSGKIANAKPYLILRDYGGTAESPRAFHRTSSNQRMQEGHSSASHKIF